jgi:hypothetical protein
MVEKITLDDAHREVVRAVVKSSTVTVVTSSAADVYVNAITGDGTTSLHKGDSAVIDKLKTLRLHIFRVDAATPFSAEIDVAEVQG